MTYDTAHKHIIEQAHDTLVLITLSQVSLRRSHVQRIDVAEDSGKKLEIWAGWIRQHGRLLRVFEHMR